MKQLTILLPLKWREEIRFPMHPKCFPKSYLPKVPCSLFQGFISVVFKSSAALLKFRLTWGTLALLSLRPLLDEEWDREEPVASMVHGTQIRRKSLSLRKLGRAIQPLITFPRPLPRAEYTETSHLGVSPLWDWREMDSGGRVRLFHFNHWNHDLLWSIALFYFAQHYSKTPSHGEE